MLVSRRHNEEVRRGRAIHAPVHADIFSHANIDLPILPMELSVQVAHKCTECAHHRAVYMLHPNMAVSREVVNGKKTVDFRYAGEILILQTSRQRILVNHMPANRMPFPVEQHAAHCAHTPPFKEGLIGLKTVEWERLRERLEEVREERRVREEREKTKEKLKAMECTTARSESDTDSGAFHTDDSTRTENEGHHDMMEKREMYSNGTGNPRIINEMQMQCC